MRFPFALTAKIAGYIIGKKLRGVEKFATVLQLEPLHTCNLTCTGCGRIREYSTSLKNVMPLEDCLGAAAECEAPMVSICGGEPLIYPQIEALVAGILKQGRIVYICTNATLMRKKMREFLAARYVTQSWEVEPKLRRLLAEDLISEKDVEEIRKGPKDPEKPVIAPSSYMYWNVHLDGLERTHDLIVEREGVFKEAVLAMRMAKILGYQVATNTTVYRETDVQEIEDLFAFLSSLGIDGHTISPGYDYDAAKKDIVARLGRNPEEFFLTRKATIEKFSKAEEWGRKFPIFGTPVYLEFLAGKRDLSCSAWAIPTRNVRGWKGPCYLMTDGHYSSYKELLEKTDWNKLGVAKGEVRDKRCEDCMMHCGYEPTASLGIGAKRGDTWKTVAFNFAPRPQPVSADGVQAFNGVSIGKGHLQELKAAGKEPNKTCGSSAAVEMPVA
ncbi:MAG: adenosyl-hopene transferase HpnH [Verrucomicrobiaceae bacterium]|nr:MAG: adenosyl-hopene transferase HpnH [Verrucomicrobiaceae bacterium]